MIEETERRLGKRVKRLLADTSYASKDAIAALGSRVEDPVAAYVTPPADKKTIKPENLLARQKERAKEPDAIKDGRKRMASEEVSRIGVQLSGRALDHSLEYRREGRPVGQVCELPAQPAVTDSPEIWLTRTERGR